ncbi:MAG: NAD(P)/FAD-dependent oxidoreductase [Thermoproteota archaeon]|nr:NAD(P)/FAD-dependent oxidoreductase [Thermoproteota archaeon]
MKFDIAIVGGGPAGLSAAYSASKKGAKVVLFEKDPSFGHNVRTSGVSWIKEIEKLGISREYYNPIKNFSFISPNNEIIISGDKYSACVLDIKKTYQFLAIKAAKEGAQLFVRSNVFGIKKSIEGHINGLKVSTPQGIVEIDSTLIIDASGFNSFISRKLGYVSFWQRYGVGAEYECYCDKINQETLYLMVGQKYSDAGYAWIFPLSDNRVRIGVGISRPESTIDPLNKLNSIMENKLYPLNKLGKIQPLEVHYGMIPNEGLRKSCVYNGFMMIGDTAGQANPLVLEGIRYAIEFGQLAGEIGADSLEFNSSVDSLKDYEYSCRKLLEKKILTALKVQSRWLALSDLEWDKEIDIIKDLTIDEFLDFIKSDFSNYKMMKLALNHPKMVARQLFNLVLNSRDKSVK